MNQAINTYQQYTLKTDQYLQKMLESHGSRVYISSGILVLLIFVGLFIGYIAYAVKVFCCSKNRRNKADRSSDDYYSEGRGTNEDQVLIEMTDDESSDSNGPTAGTAKEQKWILSFSTTGSAVADYTNNILDEIMKNSAFAKKVNEDEIVCDIVRSKLASVRIIVNHSGARLEDDHGFKVVWNMLNKEERVTDIDWYVDDGMSKTKGATEVTEDEEKLLELSFKTKGLKAKEYAEEVVKTMLRMRAFKKKVKEHEINEINDKKAEVLFILMQHAENAMQDKTILKIVTMLREDERCKKINLKVVEDN